MFVTGAIVVCLVPFGDEMRYLSDGNRSVAHDDEIRTLGQRTQVGKSVLADSCDPSTYLLICPVSFGLVNR